MCNTYEYVPRKRTGKIHPKMTVEKEIEDKGK